MADEVVAEEAAVDFGFRWFQQRQASVHLGPHSCSSSPCVMSKAILPCQPVPVHHVPCDGRVVEVRFTKTLSVS